jgi:CheY-like chemotaxis protein
MVDLSGVRALVVDDEPDARALVKRVLESNKALVLTAGSADEAIEVIQRESLDVLLSDIGMPDHDGYELLRRVRSLPASQGGAIPAVALTAFARSEDRRRALMAGFQLHVSKPVEPAELLAVVANLSGAIQRKS